MKVPKSMKKFCKKCKTHTEHKVSILKQGGRSKTHPMSRGSKGRARLRGLGRGFGNKGKWGSKPAITKSKMYGVKSSKKTNLKLKCEKCGKSVLMALPRAKKVEIE